MLQVGDMVLIKNEKCTKHNKCCNHDFNIPVEIIEINNDANFYPITVKIDGVEGGCLFKESDLQKVGVSNKMYNCEKCKNTPICKFYDKIKNIEQSVIELVDIDKTDSVFRNVVFEAFCNMINIEPVVARVQVKYPKSEEILEPQFDDEEDDDWDDDDGY